MAYDKVVDSAALDKQMLDMANAVRTKTVWTNQNKDVTSFEDENGNYNEIDARYRIPSADLAWQIRLIDKNRRMTLYPNGLDNGHYGVMAARCAETYLAARERGAAVFDYNDDVNVFNTARRKHPTGQREV